jgi:hypothetical protein
VPDADPVAVAAECFRWCADSVVTARSAAERAYPDGVPVTVVESLVESAVTAAALRAAAEHATAVQAPLELVLRRRLPELALTTLAELSAGIPAWSAADAVAGVTAVVPEPRAWERAMLGAGLVPAVRALLTTAALPDARGEDLAASLAERCRRLSAGLEDEWGGPPDVRAAGLPILTRPIADVLLIVAMGADERVSDVMIRRFAYRRFAEPAPEGLTPRHLQRSAELLDDFAGSTSPRSVAEVLR